MKGGAVAERIVRHTALAESLASRSDAELLALLATDDARRGWGVSRTVSIDGRPVFAKALPVTERELECWPSTANVFDLPIVYQYGVGSAGFGAARELAAYRRTTEWVVEGLTEHFPLLHHHRLLPLPGQTRVRSADQLDRYVAYWDDDPAVRRFIEAREASEDAVVLFVEHVPHVLMDWLPANQAHLPWVIGQGLEVTDFLRSMGAAHLDTNPSNVLTDGSQIFLGDLGLFLDDSFELDAVELAFLRGHLHLDIAEFLASLEWPIPGRSFEPDEAFRRALAPYGSVTDEMTRIFEQLAGEGGRRGVELGHPYDDERMASLLAEARRAARAAS